MGSWNWVNQRPAAIVYAGGLFNLPGAAPASARLRRHLMLFRVFVLSGAGSQNLAAHRVRAQRLSQVAESLWHKR